MRHLLFWCALLVSRLGAAATADVHLTVEAWPGFAVELHQPITFWITVANDGPDEAPNVVAFSSSFNPLIIPPPNPDSGTCPFLLTWASNPSEGIDYWAWNIDFGTIQPNTTTSCELTVPGLIVADSISTTTRVQIFSSTTDPAPDNNLVYGQITGFEQFSKIPIFSLTGKVMMAIFIAVLALITLRKNGAIFLLASLTAVNASADAPSPILAWSATSGDADPKEWAVVTDPQVIFLQPTLPNPETPEAELLISLPNNSPRIARLNRSYGNGTSYTWAGEFEPGQSVIATATPDSLYLTVFTGKNIYVIQPYVIDGKIAHKMRRLGVEDDLPDVVVNSPTEQFPIHPKSTPFVGNKKCRSRGPSE